MQMFVLSVQNSVPTAAMGAATALTQFSRQIGATLGVTVMGVIVNQGLPRAARGHEELSHRLPPALRIDLANALHPAFLAAFCVALVVWVIAFVGVKEVPLRRGFEDEPAEVATADATGELAAVDASAAPR